MVGYFAGHTSTKKNFRDSFGRNIFRTEDQIAAADVLHGAGRGNGSGDVDGSRQRGESRSSVDLFSVVHSVLHTDNQRVWRKQLGELARGFRGVDGFHAKQNNFTIARSGEFGGRDAFDVLLEL